ncbi:hypothetical protein [Actinoalloteichus spitiensis]|nr:hypothetical protein [Actinoalloteichus spitiensis]
MRLAECPHPLFSFGLVERSVGVNFSREPCFGGCPRSGGAG